MGASDFPFRCTQKTVSIGAGVQLAEAFSFLPKFAFSDFDSLLFVDDLCSEMFRGIQNYSRAKFGAKNGSEPIFEIQTGCQFSKLNHRFSISQPGRLHLNQDLVISTLKTKIIVLLQSCGIRSCCAAKLVSDTLTVTITEFRILVQLQVLILKQKN